MKNVKVRRGRRSTVAAQYPIPVRMNSAIDANDSEDSEAR